MDSAEQIAKAVRRGFWAAVIYGIVALLAVLVAPTVAIFALVFFAVAWGIRRGHAWAAIAGVCFLAVPVPIALTQSPGGEFWTAAIGVVFNLILIWFLANAAVALWKQGGRRPWPWLPAAVALALFWICFRPFVMPSASMEKTLLPGDKFLVQTATWRLGRQPRFGDLVAFHYPVDPRETHIKRVVGLPGDRLRIEAKRLYRNGAPVTEPYAFHATAYVDSYRDNFPSAPHVPLAAQGEEMLRNHVRDGEVVVPPGEYFVLGDNRDDSLDSRYWGFVKRSEIIGSPTLVYASNELAGTPGAAQPSILNTRWNRLLKPL